MSWRWRAGWAAVALTGASLMAVAVMAAEAGAVAAGGLLVGIVAITFGDTLSRTTWRKRRSNSGR